MKKSLARVAAALILGTASLFSQAASPTSFNLMNINRADGVTERLLIDTNLDFQLSEDGTLLLVHPEITIEYELTEIESFTFDYDKEMTETYQGDHQSGISSTEISEDNITFIVTLDEIRVNGSTDIIVYDLKGTKIASCKANDNGQTTLSTKPLPKGVYIIKAGSSTLKVKI